MEVFMDEEHRRGFSWRVTLHEDVAFNDVELGFLLGRTEMHLKDVQDRIDNVNRNIEEDKVKLGILVNSMDMYIGLIDKLKALKDEE